MNLFKDLWETLKVELKGIPGRKISPELPGPSVSNLQLNPKLLEASLYIETSVKSLEHSSSLSRKKFSLNIEPSVETFTPHSRSSTRDFDLSVNCRIQSEYASFGVSVQTYQIGFSNEAVVRTISLVYPGTRKWLRKIRTCLKPVETSNFQFILKTLRVLRAANPLSHIRFLGVYRAVPEDASEFSLSGRKLCFKHVPGRSGSSSIMVFENRLPSGNTKLVIIKMRE
ncbi:MAG: hypothetical protein PWP37_531 [Thermotogota bacterium]|nr:hypothetical protein [Thermotogota bacterium]MDK2864339.1 hypothetical protein [Thermotogota bacterium]HCZ05590.1 hypothetical protein [Thermotogota bacterium]